VRLLSSVERYRAGRLDKVPYDLTDPYDRAIWTALQLYVDHLERMALRRQHELGIYRVRSIIYNERIDTRSLRPKLPWELEQAMQYLKGAVREGSEEDVREVRDAAQGIIEALFTRDGAPPPSIPPGFWEAGKVGKEEYAPDAPTTLDDILAPLSFLIRAGLGSIVSQSEMAQRLGISVTAVAHRIASGQLYAIRVGRSVLIPVEEGS
jgi:excisionase family DNA binding protein